MFTNISPLLDGVSTQELEVGPNLWQLLNKEVSFPVFCVLIMVTGVLSYCLAFYQVFLGLEEDRLVTGTDEEAGVEAESIDVWATNAQEDITAGVWELGECSTNNATLRQDMESEKQEITRRGNRDIQRERESDPFEGVSVKRVLGKVKSGSSQQLGSPLTVDVEIPGLVLESSENKEVEAENKQFIKERRITSPGYSTSDRNPMSVGSEKARRVDGVNPEEAFLKKLQVSKKVQPRGETWQLKGNKWVEIKSNKNQ